MALIRIIQLSSSRQSSPKGRPREVLAGRIHQRVSVWVGDPSLSVGGSWVWDSFKLDEVGMSEAKWKPLGIRSGFFRVG